MAKRKQTAKPVPKQKLTGSDQKAKAKKPKVEKTSPGNKEKSTGSRDGGNEIDHSPKIDVNVEYLDNPVKSEYDENEYRIIKLPNGLTVFLIAAPTFESGEGFSENEDQQEIYGSCELSIDVGRFSDPSDVPRMTEYLHCLLSENLETDLEKEARRLSLRRSELMPINCRTYHGGARNKFSGKFNCGIGCEQTTFGFSKMVCAQKCCAQHFYYFLNSVAKLFINPDNFKWRMTDVRKKTDDKMKSESNSKIDLLSSLIRPDHPGSKLASKNADGLLNVKDEKLYEEVMKFKERHYSAHRMTVTVKARLSLETLEKYAVECFSGIPSNGLPPDDFSKFKGINPFATSGSQRIYTITSTINTFESEPRFNVELIWTMPPVRDYYKMKPHRYLARILRHAGEGCLFEYLEKKAWCEDISCDVGQDSFENNSLYTTFVLALRMTSEGRQHFGEVLSSIYSYINLMQREGPQKRIYDELKLTEAKKFRFTREATYPRILERGEIPRLYPPADYITGDVLYFEYDPMSIQVCMDALTPERANIILYKVNRRAPGSSDGSSEPKKVTSTAISEDVITYWKTVDSIPDFHLPKVNAFITEDYPVKIHEDDSSEIWYQRATESGDCNTYMNMHYVIPLPRETADKAVKLDVFEGILKRLLFVQLKCAKHYEIALSSSGLWVGVSDCDRNSPLLLKTITMYITGCWHLLTEDSFDAVKNDLLESHSLGLVDPTELAMDLERCITTPNRWSFSQLHAALLNLQYDQFGEYVKHFTDRMFIQCFVRGIMTKAVAIENAQKCVEILNSQTLLPEDMSRDSVVPIARGTRCCRVENFDQQRSSSVVLNHYEFESPWFGLSIIAEVFCTIMQTFLPSEGISVEHCSAGTTGYSLRSVEIEHNNMEEIDDNIELFRKSWNKKFKEMSQMSLGGLKKSALKAKIRQCTGIDRHPKRIVRANWNEIMNKEYLFERRVRELTCIDEIRNEDLRMWMTKFTMSSGGGHLRKLSIQVVRHDSPTESSANTEKAENSRKLEIDTRSARNSIGYSLRFLTRLASDKKKRHSTYYIVDSEDFKRGLAFHSK